MNKIMLINRINPQDYSTEKKKVFFSIGGMNITSVENRIFDVLHKNGFTQKDNLVLKYNGIELEINTQEIPKVVKILSEEDIAIYSIFELYNPDF